MALLDFFLAEKNTANIAKERLQIIVAERRRSDAEPHYRRSCAGHPGSDLQICAD